EKCNDESKNVPFTSTENKKVETASPPKQPFKFLIYGRTGWIGGLLGKLCEKQGIPYEYGRGRLEDRSSLMADIRNVKPTHVCNDESKNVPFTSTENKKV
ncbi:hypothetical protein, partial [Salmonella sp. s58078]|uniref:hypothetical protein n=1 Tax=Salmonella sp. s58078 TaxID=3159699 RepID=UPI00397FCE90